MRRTYTIRVEIDGPQDLAETAISEALDNDTLTDAIESCCDDLGPLLVVGAWLDSEVRT